jgi:hypothetical protein
MMVKEGIDLGLFAGIALRGFGDIRGWDTCICLVVENASPEVSKLQIRQRCLKGNLLKSLPENFSDDIKVGDIDLEENLWFPPRGVVIKGSLFCGSDDLEYTKRADTLVVMKTSI